MLKERNLSTAVGDEGGFAPELEGNMPGLVPELIKATAQEFPDYTPNIKPNSKEEAWITSTAFLFFEFGAEALTYEIGDHTPRDFIHKKGPLVGVLQISSPIFFCTRICASCMPEELGIE